MIDVKEDMSVLSATSLNVVGAAPRSAQAAIRSLYIHIPFCERKCSYCDFTSVGSARGQKEYVAALITEIRCLSEAFPEITLDTIFFGGGTPSLIQPALLVSVLTEIKHGFTVHPTAEITLEGNPSSISQARAEVWCEGGFNRISIGVQSLETDILDFLERVHNPQRALEAIVDAKVAGFSSINTDLIYAIPQLGSHRWQKTLEQIVTANPDHISAYELTVEDDTPLQGAVVRGEVNVVSAELALEQHWLTVDILQRAGYAQYEISNFARAGKQCRHNLVYWRNQPYLAAGVGAHGHLPAETAVAFDILPSNSANQIGFRYWHTPSIPMYVATLERQHLPIAGYEFIDAASHAAETILMGIRLNAGLMIKESFRMAAVKELVTDGLIVLDRNVIRVTKRGQEVLNYVALQLTEANSKN